MNLDKSINSLSKRIDRFDSLNGSCNDSNHWRSKAIIPLNEWIQLRGTPYALEYFPDDFDMPMTFLTESELKNSDDFISTFAFHISVYPLDILIEIY